MIKEVSVSMSYPLKRRVNDDELAGLYLSNVHKYRALHKMTIACFGEPAGLFSSTILQLERAPHIVTYRTYRLLQVAYEWPEYKPGRTLKGTPLQMIEAAYRWFGEKMPQVDESVASNQDNRQQVIKFDAGLSHAEVKELLAKILVQLQEISVNVNDIAETYSKKVSMPF